MFIHVLYIFLVTYFVPGFDPVSLPSQAAGQHRCELELGSAAAVARVGLQVRCRRKRVVHRRCCFVLVVFHFVSLIPSNSASLSFYPGQPEHNGQFISFWIPRTEVRHRPTR